ncbi:MAG: tetratricopeptide repeat protein [Deltaproteobacteria bacterium]|nr:tetratricopeptide repeat protein [Deltaproteobacteria bacterium]
MNELRDDDAWFSGGAREPGPAVGERPPRRRVSPLVVLGALIVALVVLGLALGAFSSPAATTATAAVDVEALRAAAKRQGGLGTLDDDVLLGRLDRLAAARRALAPPAADTAPNPTSPGDGAATTPTPIETGTTVIAAPEPPKPEPKKPEPIAKVEPKPEPVAKVEPKPEPITKIEPKPEPVAKVEPKPEPKATPEIDKAIEVARAAADAARWGEAKAAWDKVLALSPGNVKGLYGRGRAHFELRQIPAARKDLEAVLAASPKHQSALLLLGSIAQEQGKKAEARSLYERYLDAYPNGRQAAQIRALLERL